MTAFTADRTTAPTAEDRLRTVLRVDALVTAAAGVVALLGPTSSYGDVPGWLTRVIGALFLVTAAGLAVACRRTGDQLRLVGDVCGMAAAMWVIATIAILELVEMPARGEAILAIVGIATLVFAVLELRTTRTMRSAIR
jgi:hypothetical protein